MGKNIRKTRNARKSSSSSDGGTKKNASATAAAAPSSTAAGVPAHLLTEDTKTTASQTTGMQVHSLLPNYIWIVPNFLTSKECEAWIDYVERSRAFDYMNQRATRSMASRECFRWQTNDPVMAERLYRRIQAVKSLLTEELRPNHDRRNDSISSSNNNSGLTTPVGCNPNLRLYKYAPGHAFSKHIDESNFVPGMGETKFTVLVYLSDCHGGATRFFPPHNSSTSSSSTDDSIAFAPQMGAMLVHLHGEDCLLHQADPVEQGIKYVLRTDLVYSKK